MGRHHVSFPSTQTAQDHYRKYGFRVLYPLLEIVVGEKRDPIRESTAALSASESQLGK